MVKVTYRKPTITDVLELAENMRQIDIEELCVTSGMNPLIAVSLSCAMSDYRHLQAAHVDGKLACIWGVVPVGKGVGRCWVLGTDLVDKHFRRFTIETSHQLETMLQDYPKICNTIDMRQTKTIKWLQHFGCKFGEPWQAVNGFDLVNFELAKA